MTADTRTSSRSDLTALRRGAIVAYRWLVLGFLLAGGIQIFLAGLGVFSFRDQDSAAGTSAYDAHQTLGFTMGGIAVVILIAALLARPGAWPTSLAGVLVLQTCLVQSLLAGLADNTALYGGLHALDGLLALGIAGLLYASARRRRA
jgi:Family of unknown function (DUF6220)